MLNTLMTVIVALSIGVASAYSYIYGLILTGMAIVASVIWLRPESYFYLFVLFRPVADIAAISSFGSPNPAAYMNVLLFLACGLLIFRQHGRQGSFIRVFNKAYFLFLFLISFSFINTDNRAVSLLDYFRLVTLGVAVNYVAAYHKNENDTRRLAYLIFYSSIIPLALGLFQVLFHRGMMIEGFHRIHGTFTHPNVFAEYLFIVFFVGVYLLHDRSIGKAKRKHIYLLLMVMLFQLFNTYTRGVWIAFCVTGVLYILISARLAVKIKAFFIGAVGLWLMWGAVRVRFHDIIEPKGGGYLNSLEWRMELWRRVVLQVKEHPWTGNGFGMFETKMNVMAHNDYLRLAFEAGFFGLISYSILYIVMFLFALHYMRVALEADKVKYRMAISLIIGFMIMGFTDNVLRSAVVIFYFWIFLAVLLVNSGMEKHAHSRR